MSRKTNHFLSHRFPFVEPPEMTSIDSALLRLQEQDALSTIDCSLTPIGSMIARLPVDVSIGKILIFACIFQVRPLSPPLHHPLTLLFSSMSIPS